MTGSSQQMQQVYDLIRRVASIGASVLVTGESAPARNSSPTPSTIWASVPVNPLSQSPAAPSGDADRG